MMEMRITGTEAVMRKLTGIGRRLKGENIKAMRKAVIHVTNVSKQSYLSAPREPYPKTGDKLSVVSGRLRSSITHKVSGRGSDLVGTVGTNVIYAHRHEEPKPGDTMPPRPFLKPALIESREFIIELFDGAAQVAISREG